MHDSAEPYNFPKGGETEYSRLDDQHKIWTLSVEGLYPSEIEDNVKRLMEQTDTPAVLDVGCGSGIWSIQMAQQYPTARVVGVDLTPLKDRATPSNFSFRIHNLVNGLPPEYKYSFDIIHCRTVCQHVPDPQALVDSLAECLKPDGLLLVGDIELTGFDEDRKYLEPFVYDPLLSIESNLKNTGGLSWHSGWCYALAQASRSPKYQPPSVLVKQSKPLTEVIARDFWVPYGWEDNGIKHGKETGEFMEKDFRVLYHSSREMFNRRLGDIPLEIREALIQRGLQELGIQKRYLLFWYVVATRQTDVARSSDS